jgi:hypothetical protein
MIGIYAINATYPRSCCSIKYLINSIKILHVSYILESALVYNIYLDAQQKKDLGVHSRMSQSQIEKLFTQFYINYDRQDHYGTKIGPSQNF